VALLTLLSVELATGATSEPPPKIANPCHPPPQPPVRGIDAAVQRIVLDGVDAAACRLGTTREELTLSLGGTSLGRPNHWNARTIDVAVRSGMLGAVAGAVRRGELPGFLAPPLRKLIETAPLGVLVRGGIALHDLFA
jgi:hypothetical protein